MSHYHQIVSLLLFVIIEHAVTRWNCLCRMHVLIVGSIAVRVINVWNSLPDEVVSTNQLSRFKTHIKQINLNNFVTGKAWLVVLPFSSPQWFWCYYAYVYLYFYFWSRVSGVTTLRRPRGIEYCGCVCPCLFYAYFSFAHLLAKYMNEWMNES